MQHLKPAANNNQRRIYGKILVSFIMACGLSACGSTIKTVANDMPVIVFVHGNGDSAALWTTTLWRFEANGWPRTHLHALDMPYPLARDDDSVAQPGRSSTLDAMQHLKAEVERVLRSSGASKAVLVANSRGGYAVRNYLQNGGGAAVVTHAVLGGVPNHGVYIDTKARLGSEFNGAGAFLSALNAPKGAAGDEVTLGLKWLTLRSDGNDKFAQATGEWIGQRGVATGVTADGPALKGATNTLLAQRDHREVSFGPEAFSATYRFITGNAPAVLTLAPEAGSVSLDGSLFGLGLNGVGNFANNQALVGARLDVYATNSLTGERLGAAVHSKLIAADGRWGPFNASPLASHEFVITATGYATTHVYRSAFMRSSNVVHLRPERIAEADKADAALTTFVRPRGYFGMQRDTMQLDGKALVIAQPLAGSVVPGTASARVLEPGAFNARTIVASFNGETIAGRTWPLADGHVAVLELHY